MKELILVVFAIAASLMAFANPASVNEQSDYINEVEMAESESADQVKCVFKGTIGSSPVTIILIDYPDERGWCGKLIYTKSGKELEIKNGYSHALSLSLEAYDAKGVKVADIFLVGRDFEDGKSGYEGSYDNSKGESLPVRLIDETVY